MQKEQDKEDVNLEELLEISEIKNIAEEVNQSSFFESEDDSTLNFLLQEKVPLNSLEPIVSSQDEPRLENVARELSKQDEDENQIRKDYAFSNNYDQKNEYSDMNSYNRESSDSANFEIKDSIGKQLGLQELRNADSRDKYVLPKNLEQFHGGNPEQYKLRKFK
jgi:hypothetical protein